MWISSARPAVEGCRQQGAGAVEGSQIGDQGSETWHVKEMKQSASQ